MSRQAEAIAWLRDALPRHVGPWDQCFMLSIYTAEPFIHPASGVHIDPDPEEGRILEVSDQWILMRNSEKALFVCARDLVQTVPTVGSTVRITPYARRGFDGKRLDGADTKTGVPGFAALSRQWRSELPFDPSGLRSSSLRELVEQIEYCRAPDGIRRLSQVLIDAGASSEPISVIDLSANTERASVRPSLQFRIHTEKVDGYLKIECISTTNEYRLYLLTHEGELLRTLGPVSHDRLTSLIVEWIDDGKWRIAKVEVVGPDVN
ncbi:MAG: hypothetical protein ACJ8R9_05420 [Steroidobacteraceae bacterium]